jgi:HK97 family phage prohead protease
MMKTQTKALAPFEIKATDDGTMTFEGLSSTWDMDLGGDVIHKGAFTRTLDHWRASTKILPLIDQHNYGSVRAVVGKMVDARETDEGLYTQWEMLDTDDGREVFARIKGGFVDGLSIGYRVIGDAPIEDGVRHIKELALEEVSVVIWPMNPGARIQAVKAALAHMNEDELKELGVLTEETAPAIEADPEPEGLTPEDPTRLEAEYLVRDVLIRSLGAATDGS